MCVFQDNSARKKTDDLDQWFPLGVLGLSTGVLEKTHEKTKTHMTGYFRGTPGREKFRWWYSNGKRMGSTDLDYTRSSGRASGADLVNYSST